MGNTLSEPLGVAGNGAGASIQAIEPPWNAHSAPIGKARFLPCGESFPTMQCPRYHHMQYAEVIQASMGRRLQLHEDADARARPAGVRNVEDGNGYAASGDMDFHVAHALNP